MTEDLTRVENHAIRADRFRIRGKLMSRENDYEATATVLNPQKLCTSRAATEAGRKRISGRGGQVQQITTGVNLRQIKFAIDIDVNKLQFNRTLICMQCHAFSSSMTHPLALLPKLNMCSEIFLLVEDEFKLPYLFTS